MPLLQLLELLLHFKFLLPLQVLGLLQPDQCSMNNCSVYMLHDAICQAKTKKYKIEEKAKVLKTFQGLLRRQKNSELCRVVAQLDMYYNGLTRILL
jgi:hypothetical protein